MMHRASPLLPACLLSLLAPLCLAGTNPNLPLDRPYTLRTGHPDMLLAEYHRMVAGGGPRSYILPRACVSVLDSSRVCREGGTWTFLDSGHGGRLDISPLAGLEYRYRDEHVQAFDPGILATGGIGPVSFHLDARMFTEAHQDAGHPSYDREVLDRQDEEQSGTLAYTSYARYRSNASYDWSWGRLTVARDAAHWGPGMFHNLVFHQDAVPFNQLVFTTSLGPFTVSSLYGSLRIQGDGSGDYPADTLARNLYAHRYEWRISRNWLAGISEQLILSGASAPFAFTPILPLFMAKGFEQERSNNGGIAGDLSYRIPGKGHLYAEFLIDDILSPTSLFDDFWGNKWAWMAGAHGILPLGRYQAGLVGEYSRVEPWVYTSYERDTHQAANAGFPLGNQLGPNSQAFTLKGYLGLPDAFHLSGRVDLQWKGDDLGSSLDDDRNFDSPPLRKEFLRGVGSPDILVTPAFAFRLRRLAAEARATVGAREEFALRLSLAAP